MTDSTSRRDLMVGTLGVTTLGVTTLAMAADAVAQPVPPRPKKPAEPNPGVSPIDRAFVRIAEGPVHYRYMDRRGRKADLPIVMCHASPGSSERLVPLIPGLAVNRLVVALDTLGNGDSAPPAMRETTIAYYVDATIRAMDQLGLEKVDFYGTHTGAQIGAEMAVRHPKRIRKIAFDGLALFTDAYKKEAIANYAPEMKAQADGSHLMWAWNRSGSPTTPPDEKQASVMMQLKALTTYHIAYKAAFAHDVHALLPQIKQDALVMAIKRDPLHEFLDDVNLGIKGSKKVLVPTEAGAAGKLAALQEFFGIKA